MLPRKVLPINQVQPGMVLARDLLDSRGTRLLGADAVLSASVLAQLAQRGFDSLTVFDPDGVEQPEVDEAAVRARLDLLFGEPEPDSPAAQLKAAVLAYRLGGGPA